MLYCFIVIFILLLSLEIGYIKFAKSIRLYDTPNDRSSHDIKTINGGGIIVPVAMIAYCSFFAEGMWWFVAGLLLVSAVSFATDVRELSVYKRLVAHFLAITAMAVQLDLFAILPWWSVPLAIVVGVWTINGFNFMDGINGITPAYALAVLIPLMIMNSGIGFIQPEFLYVATVAVVVFAIFNFRKRALCFAGDVGAIAIGFVLLYAIAKLMIATSSWMYMTFVCVYAVDVIFTLGMRAGMHENLFKAHRMHVYQRLANECSIPHLFVAAAYAVLQLAISLMLVFVGKSADWVAWAAWISVMCAYLVFSYKVKVHK